MHKRHIFEPPPSFSQVLTQDLASVVFIFFTVEKRRHEMDLVGGSRIEDASLAPTIEEAQATLEVVSIILSKLVVCLAVRERVSLENTWVNGDGSRFGQT